MDRGMERIQNREVATPPRRAGMRKLDIFGTNGSFLCFIIILSNSKHARSNNSATTLLTGSQKLGFFKDRCRCAI